MLFVVVLTYFLVSTLGLSAGTILAGVGERGVWPTLVVATAEAGLLYAMLRWAPAGTPTLAFAAMVLLVCSLPLIHWAFHEPWGGAVRAWMASRIFSYALVGGILVLAQYLSEAPLTTMLWTGELWAP